MLSAVKTCLEKIKRNLNKLKFIEDCGQVSGLPPSSISHTFAVYKSYGAV